MTSENISGQLCKICTDSLRRNRFPGSLDLAPHLYQTLVRGDAYIYWSGKINVELNRAVAPVEGKKPKAVLDMLEHGTLGSHGGEKPRRIRVTVRSNPSLPTNTVWLMSPQNKMILEAHIHGGNA